MARLLPAPSQTDTTLIPAGATEVPRSYFRLVRLERGASVTDFQPNHELLAVVLAGTADVAVGTKSFDGVGQRDSVWTGLADSVYAGTQDAVTLTAVSATCEIALAGGYCEADWEPFRIPPPDVETVEVGSVETHSRRRICHILGQNANGRAGHLLVSELYADPGCWSGYPPHKHDEENPPAETAFEEIYHYRFAPETGFGAQFHYRKGEPPQVCMTTHGTTFMVDDGFHPTSTSPGHRGYIFTILVGKHQRSLIQRFEEKHQHLMADIPGLQIMRDKFK